MGTAIELRKNHEALLRALIKGKPLLDAAAEAGMGEYAAWQVSRTPRFMAAMRAELDAALVGEGAPIAYNILKEILHDPARYNADTKTLVSAAKTLLNAVVAAPKAAEAPASAPEPSAMDTRALQAFVAQGMAELANRAKPIEPGDGDIFG